MRGHKKICKRKRHPKVPFFAGELFVELELRCEGVCLLTIVIYIGQMIDCKCYVLNVGSILQIDLNVCIALVCACSSRMRTMRYGLR